MSFSCLIPVTKIENLEITPNPNWLELPRDITINILRRLGTVELVTSASVACPLWWNICKDPLMWSTIDMITNISVSYSDYSYSNRLEKICHYAVQQSCGHLKDIYIKNFGTDDLLLHIANSANQLRCIWLEGCHDISNEALKKVVKKQPFLEELDICHCSDLRTDFFKYIGKCCPLLKSMRFSPCIEAAGDYKCDDVAFVIAESMYKLRHLTILNNQLTKNGLLAVLDGCPLLESLDIRGCLHLHFDRSLEKRCNTQIKELRFPTEYIAHKFNFGDYMYYLQLKLTLVILE
ncbi:putative F-box/LRR-repeat protein 23 [Vicia villosa]|uniref:putative F-box/LRR-repeat protein 23 n=1 Tax=Vicia villosa TaxID=3911 RepID=UPI00273BDCB8|nr:putative F-box/LRR-repeat protein 23 [Vicia villosa]